MSTCCYFNGVRLWKNASTLRANPRTSGAMSKIGLGKKRARMYPRSPNALYDISVMTSVPPVTQISATVGRQATHHLYMLQTEALLVDQGRGYGHLAWVVDNDTNDLTGSNAGGAAQTIALASYAGFTPVTGDYLLFRNPVTGDGFVTVATAVGAGPPYTVQCNMVRTGLDRADENVATTSAWEVLRVAYYFPYAQYQQVGWTETPSQAEDKHGTCQWRFISEANALYPTTSLLDLT